MRPVPVVVIHEHRKEPFEMRLIQGEEPVEAFGADRAHKPFGDSVGLRRAKRCPHDFHPVASEDLIKRLGELLIAIPNQIADRLPAFP